MSLVLALLLLAPLYLVWSRLWKWHRLAHIPQMPRAPRDQRGPWPLGDMRHCGPMSDPFRVAQFLATQMHNLSTSLAVYRDYFADPHVMLLSVRAAEDVMCGAGARIWQKPPTTAAVLTEMVGQHSLLVLEGDPHDRVRRIVTPLFAYDRLVCMSTLVAANTDRLVSKWRTLGKIDDIYEDVSVCTLSVMVQVVVDGGESVRKQLVDDYYTVLKKNSLSHLALFALGLLPRLARYMPLNELRAHFEALDRIKQTLRELVLLRRDCNFELPERDMLAALMQTRTDRNDRLSDVEVLHQTLTFVTAGHGTTSVTVCWALYLLAMHEDIQEAVRREYVEAMREHKDKGGNWLEMVDGLAMLEGVVRETLRLFPGIVMTARVATKDCMVDGVWMPKGTIASIPIMALQRSKSVWGEDALQFRPQRHKKGHVQREWIAFLRGSHSCIGGRMGMLQVKGMLCRVVEQVKMRVSAGCEIGALGVVLVPTGVALDVERVE